MAPPISFKPVRMVGLGLVVPIMLLFSSCAPAGGQPSSRQDESFQAGAGEVDCGKVTVANPAASYCSMLGYAYGPMTTASGETVGACSFPDGSSCPQWDFYTGKCGQDFSYCAKNGYKVATATDGNDPYSREYSVCVDEQGKVIGSASRLSGLADAINTCR